MTAAGSARASERDEEVLIEAEQPASAEGAEMRMREQA